MNQASASSAFQTLSLNLDPRGVATVRMNRPAVFNAFNEAMIVELDNAFQQLEADSSVRVVVLEAAGKHFSAGADLQWMQRASVASQADNVKDARVFAAMLARIAQLNKPTIAKVQGAALGGGFGLVAACDIAIASARASFSVSEAKFGILPAVIGPYVIQAIGKRAALRLALTTTKIDATEALRLGLLHSVVRLSETTTEAEAEAQALQAALDAAVETTIAEILHCGPNALAEIKALFAKIPVGTIDESVRELTAQTIARVRTGAEAKAGFAAFFAKQPAPWVK